ncbi:DUF1330 domain-containing protein [Paracoccus sp. Z330]|uniref:DUF1330 domain-containing protein n=1 Tax=Paracoccus onchidii TaxID=3017813 RepID=A0ABT4ZAU3_9RHOB|nr:DUF1330 domain-containing protein [Paracoccus onchidii]MDB6176063.1 DUF1330 domain-containing protein [Paracoccus onchidii]
MTCYSVLAVTPTETSWVEGYRNSVNDIVAKHGGRYLARTVDHQQVEGIEQPAGMRIILEWPSKEAALSFLNDPEYAPWLSARSKGSVSTHFIIEAQDDLA